MDVVEHKNFIGGRFSVLSEVGMLPSQLMGLSENKFRFVKKYANVNQMINLAVKRYKTEVLKKQFPKAKHSFKN